MVDDMLGVKDIKGLITDLMEKLGGPNGQMWLIDLKKFLRGELSAHLWHEHDGVIYFFVTSDGTTGSQWIERLEKRGLQVSEWAKDILLSPDFKPTNGVKYFIIVLKGELFQDDDRTTQKICNEANKRKLAKPNAEVACLIREMFTNEEIETMGLWWIIVMHDHIKDSYVNSGLLSASRHTLSYWLDARYDKPDNQWLSDSGFAFVGWQAPPGS